MEPVNNENALEIITVGLDEGERVYVEDVGTRKAWINTNPVNLFQLVTFADTSHQDFPIVKKATKGDIACGYIISKDKIKTDEQLTICKMVLLGHILRLPCTHGVEIHSMDKLYINNNGLIDKNNTGRNLKLLSTQHKASNDTNNYIVCFRQIGDNYIHSERKYCLDLMNSYFTQNQDTGEIFLHYNENSILKQCRYIEDDEGNTQMVIPDIAILNTILYTDTEIAASGEHWAHRIYMNFNDCTQEED